MPVALIAVCVAAASGTLVAWNVSYVRFRAAIVLAAFGCCTAPLGLLIADRLPQASLAAAFAAVLIAVALRMFLQARRNPEDTRVVRATVAGDGSAAAGPICRTNATTAG